MPALESFPHFSRLPTEIRLLVWEYFVLLKAPVLYICCFWSDPTYRFYPELCRRIVRTQADLKSILRCLMQVNREARGAVLNTLQLYRLPACLHSQGRIPLLRDTNKILFINWEKDFFWYPAYHISHPFLHQALFKGRIKNIAFDISKNSYGKQDRASWGAIGLSAKRHRASYLEFLPISQFRV